MSISSAIKTKYWFFDVLTCFFAAHIQRAVILFSPMVEVLYEKLSEEVPYKFVQCKPGT